jgi:peptidyl-prolyl cis-trans isomerase B (cyclophilin B)
LKYMNYALRGLAATLCLGGVLAAPMAVSAHGRAANPIVEMTIAKRGKITIELDQKASPKTVAHFLELVNRKFYNGILAHRVRKGFMVQAGDPMTKTIDPATLVGKSDEELGAMGVGSGGSGPKGTNKNIPFESNDLTHETGTLAMARSQERDSADSQFFINLVPNHRLDGDYCVFGKVTKGMDVVNKIQQGDKIASIVLISPKKK